LKFKVLEVLFVLQKASSSIKIFFSKHSVHISLRAPAKRKRPFGVGAWHPQENILSISKN
jgi:hypothetical protein